MTLTPLQILSEKIVAQLLNKEVAALPAIERDILKQNLREFYEQLGQLKSEPAQMPPAKPVIKLPEVKPVVTEKLPVIEVAPPVVKAQPPVESVTQPRIEKEKNIAVNTLNKSVDLSTSLNEKLKTNSVTEVHRKLSTRPLKDLIDLNKKHVMVNELFAGNAANYSAAIDEIDNLPAYETAHDYIRSRLFPLHKWDEASQPVRMFLKLIRQKFGME